jgi:transglutaminase-like putative cysteine protease
MALRSYSDLYDNPCTQVVLPAGTSSFRTPPRSTCPTPSRRRPLGPRIAPDDLPDRRCSLPSRYCLPDVLGGEAWTVQARPGYRRVQAICDHVHPHLTFAYGSSTAWSTAADVNGTRFGVCRDYTHLAISFCRALNIPARYVFGYLPDLDVELDGAEMDFAAWMEVWLEDRWWTFDPRNNVGRKGTRGDRPRP